MKIRLYSKGGETVVKYAQKKSTNFVVGNAIIILVTPPNTLYSFATPNK